MIDNLLILETALTIRPELSRLLGIEAGEQMRQELDELLQQAQAGEPIEISIQDLLMKKRATGTWVTEFQERNVTQKGFNGLPGDPSEISAPKFKCPQCDYTWSRQSIGRPMLRCKVHDVPLEPVQA